MLLIQALSAVVLIVVYVVIPLLNLYYCDDPEKDNHDNHAQ